MALTIPHDDPRLTWQGVASLHRTAEWTMPWRLPYERRVLFPPEALLERAAMPAGVRIAFRSDTTRVAGAFEGAGEIAKLEICCDGAVVGGLRLAGRDTFAFENLPAGDKLVELWLPQFGEFRLRSLDLSDGATLEPFADDRPRWITYGSSITQCRTAEGPTQTWPAIVARERGLNLTCLGFGGQCHLDPMIARLMRDMPADFLSICVGINVHGAGSLNARTFIPAAIGFVQILRETHVRTPLAVISPIYSPPREETPNAVGFSLQEMRKQVAAAVAMLQAAGDRNVHYIDGLDLFGPGLVHLLPDDLHPDAAGYKAMGRNFLDKVIARLYPAPPGAVKAPAPIEQPRRETMTETTGDWPTTRIAPVEKEHGVLALGCWTFGGAQWGGQEDEDSLRAMEAALQVGMNHFDTATGYGSGRSERLIGQFLQGRRDQVFLASKASTGQMTAEAILKAIDASRERLQTDTIDLYYIHWPRTGADMRPIMEGLEQARAQGWIGAIGVSNFSVEQMEHISEAGKIDAHQLNYSLLWRFDEGDIIPYCRDHGIAVVTYSSIAQGILTGKFPRHPEFKEGDQRPKTVFFDENVWPHIYEGVERMKKVAVEVGRPLAHLAIRWVAQRPDIASVLVGVRDEKQVEENAAAMRGEIPAAVFDRLTRISDETMANIPDAGNIFKYYP